MGDRRRGEGGGSDGDAMMREIEIVRADGTSE